MRILVAEDDQASRMFLVKYLSQFGECDFTVDGMETLDAYLLSLQDNMPYDLICLDIMMPKANGVKVLNSIRSLERKKRLKKSQRAKVIIITALAPTQYIIDSLTIGYDTYIEKPAGKESILNAMKELGLLQC